VDSSSSGDLAGDGPVSSLAACRLVQLKREKPIVKKAIIRKALKPGAQLNVLIILKCFVKKNYAL